MKNLSFLIVWAGVTAAGCVEANPAYRASGDAGEGPKADAAGPADGAGTLDAGAVDMRDVGPSGGCESPVVVTGTGLNAEYFDNPDFTGTRVARVDPTINFSFPGSPDPALDENTFSGRWTGKLQPSVSGVHTFHVAFNDGVRLFLDDRVVIYRWGDHATTETSASVNLVAGHKYDLRMEFYDQSGSATARLAWQTPCRAREIIPATHLHPESAAPQVCLPAGPVGTGRGLLGEYTGGGQVLRRSDARLDFDWGTGSPFPMAGFPVDAFTARWTGELQAPVTGPLTIYLQADDVGRAWLGGAALEEPLLDSWSEVIAGQEVAATIDVVAGQMLAVRIEMQERTGPALARLSWSWPCQPRQVVPTDRLYAPP